MTHYKYSTNVTENMAKAVLMNAPVSTKQCIEICNLIRGKTTEKAKTILRDVVSLKKPIPLKRFVGDVGHKPGMGPGRYPVKASQAVLDLLESVEANAQFKGLSTDGLVIVHISSQRASRPMRYGRQRGRQAKRTSVEVVVEEAKKAKKPNQKAVLGKHDTAKRSVEKKPDAKPEEKAVQETASAKQDATQKAPKAQEKPEAKPETKAEEKKVSSEQDTGSNKQGSSQKPAEKSDSKPADKAAEVKKEEAKSSEKKADSASGSQDTAHVSGDKK